MEAPNQYQSSTQNFIASPNPIEEDSFMAKTTDIILSELESLDSTKMLTTQLQNQPINVENILTSNSSFSPPSSKESSEIGNRKFRINGYRFIVLAKLIKDANIYY